MLRPSTRWIACTPNRVTPSYGKTNSRSDGGCQPHTILFAFSVVPTPPNEAEVP